MLPEQERALLSEPDFHKKVLSEQKIILLQPCPPLLPLKYTIRRKTPLVPMLRMYFLIS